MEENEDLEYSCSECNSIVGKDDTVCFNCGADLSEIVTERSETKDKLPKFIKIVAIIFLIFNSLKLLNNTFEVLGGIIYLFSSQQAYELGGEKFVIGPFSNLPLTILIILLVIDWIPTILLFISSIGLLTSKIWSIKLTIKSLYFAIIVNVLFILGLLTMNFYSIELEFISKIFSIGLVYLIVQSALYYFVIWKLSSEKFKSFPSISVSESH